jgi:hypothetical protein
VREERLAVERVEVPEALPRGGASRTGIALEQYEGPTAEALDGREVGVREIGLGPRVDLEAHGTEVHLCDRVMPVAALRRRREPNDLPGLRLTQDALELHGRQVMTFVDDDLPVARDEIGDRVLLHEALDHRHVHATRRCAPRARDLAHFLAVDAEKESKLREPLIQKTWSPSTGTSGNTDVQRARVNPGPVQ